MRPGLAIQGRLLIGWVAALPHSQPSPLKFTSITTERSLHHLIPVHLCTSYQLQTPPAPFIEPLKREAVSQF